MMWKTKAYAQTSALPAIAAALALSSTPALSQEIQPTAEPDPVTISPPPPTVETAPGTTDTTVTDPTPAVDTTTQAAPAVPKPKAKPAASKATSSAPTRKATAVTHVASSPPEAAAASAAPPVSVPSTPQPIVDARPQADATPTPAATKPALNVDENALMLGGGALALLALGGGAFAFSRRRRHEDELVEETAMSEPMAVEPEPAPIPRHDVIHDVQPAIVAPSAFAWGNEPKARAPQESEDESWVERAYRGPTPENPSLSLRKRLKRAAFFDAREKRVAAGKAQPVDLDAGLPENAVSERELEFA